MRRGDFVKAKISGADKHVEKELTRYFNDITSSSKVKVYGCKEAFIVSKTIPGGLLASSWKKDGKRLDSMKQETRDIKDFFGMVVDYDYVEIGCDEIVAIACVSVGEEMWWLPAYNLELIRKSQGMEW